MAKKSSKSLTPEDKRLWKKVTDDVTPRRGMKRPDDDDPAGTGESNLEVSKLPGLIRDPLKVDVPGFSGRDMKKYAHVSGNLPPLVPLNRKQKSKLSKGAREIEGKLDLHGLTRAAAQDALYGFILHAHLNRWKTVLIITGKGSQKPNQMKNSVFIPGEDQSGVLRRYVPQWLSSPHYRKYVMGFEPAAPSHGGNGALYVQIRRKK